MEESLKFNSQVCTNIKQSQRLLELGLKPETADMIYMQIDGSWICIISQGDEEYIPYEDHFPAWSLHRLLSIGIDGDYMGLWNININRDTVEDLFEQLIRLIEWAIKDGAFNKEYLSNERIY